MICFLGKLGKGHLNGSKESCSKFLRFIFCVFFRVDCYPGPSPFLPDSSTFPSSSSQIGRLYFYCRPSRTTCSTFQGGEKHFVFCLFRNFLTPCLRRLKSSKTENRYSRLGMTSAATNRKLACYRMIVFRTPKSQRADPIV